MHYVIHRSHWIQQQKFNITCPSALLMEITPGPTEHEKLCVDVSRWGCTGKHYVTRRSHQIQKTQVRHNVSWCAFFLETAPGPPEHEK
jgi:hypothetical protein